MDNLHGVGNGVSFTQNLCQVLEQDQRWNSKFMQQINIF